MNSIGQTHLACLGNDEEADARKDTQQRYSLWVSDNGLLEITKDTDQSRENERHTLPLKRVFRATLHSDSYPTFTPKAKKHTPDCKANAQTQKCDP
jgi:hypothetical protein